MIDTQNIVQKPKQTVVQSPELILIKSKLPILKHKQSQKFSLCFQILPKDQTMYQQKIASLTKFLEQNPQNPNINEWNNIILGVIQGSSGALNLAEYFEQRLKCTTKQNWQNIIAYPQNTIKQKFTIKFLGGKNKLSHTIRELKDLNQIQQIYDIESIKNHRKICKQYGTFYRTLQKFIQKLQTALSKQQQSPLSQSSIKQLFDQYTKLDSEQKKYIKLLQKTINKPSKTIKNIDAPIISEQNKQQQENRGDISKIENVVKTAKNTEKMNKNTEKTQKKSKKQSKKQQKSNEQSYINNIAHPQNNQQIKQNSQQIKQKQNNKQQQKKAPSSAKKAKPTLQSQYKSLDSFFLPKKKIQPKQPQIINKQVSNNNTIIKNDDQNKMEIENQKTATDLFLQNINSGQQKVCDLSILKDKFIGLKKQENKKINLNCYINIVVCKSRLEYYDYLITQPRMSFTNPLEDVDNIRYEDSSDQYSELVADSINQQMIQQDDEQEQQQSNSAIVPDSYCQYKSDHVFSSDSQSSQTPQKQQLKPQTIRGNKWSFFRNMRQNDKKYVLFGQPNKEPQNNSMIYVGEQPLPLITRQNNDEATDDITTQMKIQMYKQIHGSYLAKQNLVKKINTIIDNKISMNKLNVLLKDITQKQSTQRVIKPQILKQFLQQMTEISPNLQQQFQQLQKQRQRQKNHEIQAKRQQKNIEKQQKLQKYILQYTGTMSIKQLIVYLKSNDIKIPKSQLSNFIKNHEGEQWEHIKEQIKKTKLTKGRKPKLTNQDQQQIQKNKIKNSHRPIEQILKQNQIDLANRPKKVRKVQEQMIDEAEYERRLAEQQQLQHIDNEDQSYNVTAKNKKKKKLSKNNKNKKISKIPTIQCSIPSVGVRRNPRRNKNKTKKIQKDQQESIENKQQMRNQDMQMEVQNQNQQKQEQLINNNGISNNEENQQKSNNRMQEEIEKNCNQSMIQNNIQDKDNREAQDNQQSKSNREDENIQIQQQTAKQIHQKTANKDSGKPIKENQEISQNL